MREGEREGERGRGRARERDGKRREGRDRERAERVGGREKGGEGVRSEICGEDRERAE